MANISDRTLGKLVTLATLTVGLAIGFAGGVVYRPQQSVQAQGVTTPTPTVQEVSPGVTTGTFGANLILAHEVATDHMVINGFDLMLMQQNILNYLASRPLAERADIENLINSSRASTIYRIKQSPPSAPNATPPSPEKK